MKGKAAISLERVCNNILTNKIQGYMKVIKHHNQVEFISGMQVQFDIWK